MTNYALTVSLILINVLCTIKAGVPEEWVRWEPIAGLEGKYRVDFYSYGEQELEVLLSKADDKNCVVKLTFDRWIYRNTSTSESYRLEVMHHLRTKYGDMYREGWTFFRIVDSDFLDKTGEFWDGAGLKHFTLVACNCVLSILCRYEPKVELITMDPADSDSTKNYRRGYSPDDVYLCDLMINHEEVDVRLYPSPDFEM